MKIVVFFGFRGICLGIKLRNLSYICPLEKIYENK